MIRTVVIFENFGPYHLARADALSKVKDIDPHFVELASADFFHPWWETVRDKLNFPLATLASRPYQQTPVTKRATLVRELSRVLRRLGPDCVVIPGYRYPPMLAAALWARVHGAASIMMFDSTAWDYKRVWWKEQIKRLLIGLCFDAGFVGGKASRHYLSQLGMSPSCIWERYDVVNNAYFTSGSRRVLESAAKHRTHAALPQPYFLYVGRFYPEKNLVRLLQAYRRYRDMVPGGWGLVLVGDGPQREELLRTTKNLNLYDVVWPGYKQNGELLIYYALSSGFILPSIREPWGLVVNEAMASGLPVLVSNRCGCALDLVVEGNNGYTFDPLNVEEIADRMVRLTNLSEADRVALANASKSIIAGYTTEVWAETLADCIRQTVERSKSRRPR